ncbi:Vacuolar sorting protein 9 domain, putative isoform 1 [Theobroma cacao]|uniref:Vacuolar sorting protein 9 domain, putative isoform 1 n=1 Tax=Theobroma cacao TaxID=3641 RepID=A0A061EK44_THECC|nr:Vacuolar sorting protein 9 domain, putative isoform 1 [Theobroma cacao]
MKPSLMGTLNLKFSLIPLTGFLQNPQNHKRQHPSTVTCGLRGGTRKHLWRSRVLSAEAIQAVHSLKLANSNSKLQHVFSNKLSRLLKADLLDTLAELQRQNEFHLALEVFEFVRKEVWYKPDLSLYCDMIQLLGKNRMTEMAERVFTELDKEGLKPDTRAFTEMIGAYLIVGMTDKAMETYEMLKASGCCPDKLTFTILIRNLENAGREDLAAVLKKDCTEYLEYPERFLEQVQQKHLLVHILASREQALVRLSYEDTGDFHWIRGMCRTVV